jgi:hypothetical protein
MSWEWETTHSDFYAAVDGIENPLDLDVRVDPAVNGGADVLSFYTGTLMVGRLNGFGGTEFPGPSSSAWSRGIVRFRVPTPGRRWTFIPLDGIPEPDPDAAIPERSSPFTYFYDGTVVVSLASIYNKNVANNAGWAVDGADLQALGNEVEGLQVEAKIAVRDSDGYLYRLSYQVTALGQAPIPTVGGVSLA